MDTNSILDVNMPLNGKEIVSKYKLNVDEKDQQFVQNITDVNVPILMEVLHERIKQEKKWGKQNHDPLKWNAILGEEFGEVSKAILERDRNNYREELIQVAAVAIAAIECLDRSKKVVLVNSAFGKTFPAAVYTMNDIIKALQDKYELANDDFRICYKGQFLEPSEEQVNNLFNEGDIVTVVTLGKAV